jgi:NADPH2:quinone reductase
VLGADLAINYRELDFVKEVNAFTDGRDVDVVLAMVGGEYLARNLKVMGANGRLVNIAFCTAARLRSTWFLWY